jgi:hypothetical protein
MNDLPFVPCHEHRKYKGARRPTADCRRCWEIYFDRRPKEPITGEDMVGLLKTLDRDFFERSSDERLMDQIATRLTEHW